MDGTNAVFGGNGVANHGTAKNFIYFGTARNETCFLPGNGSFTGLIYAPDTQIICSDIGNTLTDFTGSMVGKSVQLKGHCSFHFDESQLRSGWIR